MKIIFLCGMITNNCFGHYMRPFDPYYSQGGQDKYLIETIFKHKKNGVFFDIILDDGGHTMKQQITSFKILYPFVKKGGIYIIEDLHTSYWKNAFGACFGGNETLISPQAGAGTTINFLQSLVNDINFGGARTACSDPEKYKTTLGEELTIYQKEISHIIFYPGICFIFKS